MQYSVRLCAKGSIQMGSNVHLFDNHCGLNYTELGVEAMGSMKFCGWCKLGIIIRIITTVVLLALIGIKLLAWRMGGSGWRGCRQRNLSYAAWGSWVRTWALPCWWARVGRVRRWIIYLTPPGDHWWLVWYCWQVVLRIGAPQGYCSRVVLTMEQASWGITSLRRGKAYPNGPNRKKKSQLNQLGLIRESPDRSVSILYQQ